MATGRKTGGGSRKGKPNKATADVRAMIALVAERHVGKLEGWITLVAKKDPAKAADLFLRMIEYHIPKQARTEITGKDGDPLDGFSNSELRELLAAWRAHQPREIDVTPEPEPPALQI